MKVVVLNCGSSSIKYQLFDMEKKTVLAKGGIEKIGLRGSFLKYESYKGDKVTLEGEILDHQAGIEYILGILSSKKRGVISTFGEIEAVGHRVVLGGESFTKSILINDSVLEKLEEYTDLAPLHNPANLKGIYAMQNQLPNVPQVAVFDTAFHQTMPEYAYMYAVPYSLYTKYGIRRYGFHGTSHRFVSKRVCELMNRDITTQKIITCHLGNGASLAAIQFGKSIDTSMGLTPVEGLIMGTRAGDVDAGLLTHIMNKEKIDIQTTNVLINKHSGMLGITGVSSDMREIVEAAESGNERAKLGLEMYRYRVVKYIGAYAAAMNGLDAIVFTGGVGEHSLELRGSICSSLSYFGIDFDPEANMKAFGIEMPITKPGSKVQIWVVPTNEELVIAQDTLEIVSGK